MDIIEGLKRDHAEQVAFYEEVLKYARKTTRVKVIKRNIQFHKWVLSLVKD